MLCRHITLKNWFSKFLYFFGVSRSCFCYNGQSSSEGVLADALDVCGVNLESSSQVKKYRAVAVFQLRALLKLNNKKESSNKIPTTPYA
jgi:hypothetical protein